MKKRALITLTLCLSLVTGSAFADVIKIEAGINAVSTVFAPIKSRYEQSYGDTLIIVQSSAVKALIALSEGRVDLAAGAHPLEDLITGAAKAGVVVDPSRLVATQIEVNRLAVIVNKSNSLQSLSKEQLKGILSGKISDWSQVGGAQLPIEVVWGKETHGQNAQIGRVVLEGTPVTSKVREAATYRDIAQLVSETPGAIGIIPLQLSTPAIHRLETVDISSPLFVFTIGPPSKKVQQILDLYRSEFSFLKE